MSGFSVWNPAIQASIAAACELAPAPATVPERLEPSPLSSSSPHAVSATDPAASATEARAMAILRRRTMKRPPYGTEIDTGR